MTCSCYRKLVALGIVEFPVVFSVTEDKFEFDVSKELHVIDVYFVIL